MNSKYTNAARAIRVMGILTLLFGPFNYTFAADDAAYATCVAEVSAKSMACTVASQLPAGSAAAYSSGKNAVCDLNFHVIENVNHMLCFLKHQISFDGSATGTATISSDTYAWTYATADLESFATDRGYTQKLSVSKAGKNQMTMWWDGTGDETKGYMISNKLGVSLSNELAIYVQWDKTTAAQWVRYLRGTWSATVNTDGPMDAKGGEINRGKYGYLQYNTGTKRTSALEIVDVKGDAGGVSLMCEKFRIWGNMEGSLGIFSSTGGASTSTVVDASNGSGSIFATTTGLSTASLSSFAAVVDSVTGPGNYSKSCNSIYATRKGGASELFAANADSIRLTFTAIPLTVFGNAAP